MIQRFWKRQPRSSTSIRVFGKGNAVDFALSADEKTSLLARSRKRASLLAVSAIPAHIEHEYERRSWVYLAAWHVRCAKAFDRCPCRDGIQHYLMV